MEDERYEALKAEFEAFKAEAAERERLEGVRGAYRALLHDCGIPGARAEKVLRVTDVSGLSLDEGGRLNDEAALRAEILREWPEFIAPAVRETAPVATPPAMDQTTDAFILGFDD